MFIKRVSFFAKNCATTHRPNHAINKLNRLFVTHVETPFILDTKDKAFEHLETGNKFWDQGDIPQATTSYEKSIAEKPSPDAFYNLANCKYYQKDFDSAIKNWKKSLELDPNRSDVHLNLANVYALNYQEYATAVSHYEAAIRLSTQDGEIRFNYGVVLEKMGRIDDAIDAYSVALKLGVERAKQNLRNCQAKKMIDQVQKSQ